MPLAVLGPYQLVECISRHSYGRVYLAEGEAGRRFVVKFLMEADAFFEELARHYALDSCDHLCKLVVNYPSYAVCGDPFMFRKGLASLFGHDDFDGRHMGEEEMLVSPLADIGVLVFEYIEGDSLAAILPSLPIEDQFKRLFQLAEALLAIHRLGECHGDLIAPNVLVERESQALKLLDLGYFPNKPLPEGQFRAPHQGRMIEGLTAADDAYMLARNFMSLVPCQQPRFRQLVDAALSEDPRQRPSLELIVQVLRSCAGLEVPTENRSPRSWPVRYALPLAAAAALLVSMLVWEPNRFSVNAIPASGVEVELSQLSDLQRNQRDQALAATVTGRGPIAVDLEDFHTPYAVFSHDDNPVLIGAHRTYKLGDPLLIGGAQGKMLSITPKEVVISLASGLRAYALSSSVFHPRVAQGESGWYVWPHTDNLARLLDGSASLVGGWEEKARTRGENNLCFLLRHHRKDLRIAAESVYGYYPAVNARHFLVLLERQLAISPKGQSFQVGLREGAPSLYRTFDHFMVEDATVKAFCRYLGEMTGLEIQCPAGLQNQLLPRRLYTDVAWQDILDAMGFDWSYREGRRGPYVEIHSMNI